MKRTILIILFALFYYLLLWADPIAIVLKIKGNVSIESEGKEKSASAGDLLFPDDKIYSEKESFAALKFIDDGAIIRLFPDSEIKINATMDNKKINKKSILKKGSILSKVKRKFGSYEVETPSAIASVKGTEFLTILEESGATTLYTIEGVVNLKNRIDANEKDVEKGQKAYSYGKGVIEIVNADISELGRDYLNYIDDWGESKTIEIEFKNQSGERKMLEFNVE